MSDPIVRTILGHLEAALVSRERELRRDLAGHPTPTPGPSAPTPAPGGAEADVLSRVTLSDILDATALPSPSSRSSTSASPA